MSKRREYASGREHILGQSRAALAFILVSVLVFGVISLALSPLTPEWMMMLGIRASLDRLNIGDSGVSDYYAFYKPAGLARNFVVSYVPGADDNYRVILDYLMFLNRSHNVTLALVDIAPASADLLNSYIAVADTYDDIDNVFAAYRTSVAGSEYATDEFRSFIDGVVELNRSLTPSRKIKFGGVGTSDIISYTEHATDGGTLLILSRYASHSENGILSNIRSSDIPYEYQPMLVDILYIDAPLKGGETRTDIRLPFVSGGIYTASRTGLDALGDYRDFTLRATSMGDVGNPGDLTDFVSEYFFIIVTDPDAESTDVTTDEITTNEITTAEVTTDEVTTDEVTTDEVTTDEVMTDEVTTDEMTSDGTVDGTETGTAPEMTDTEAVTDPVTTTGAPV